MNLASFSTMRSSSTSTMFLSAFALFAIVCTIGYLNFTHPSSVHNEMKQFLNGTTWQKVTTPQGGRGGNNQINNNHFAASEFGLSREQCAKRFDTKTLYAEIDRSFAYWHKLGGISRRAVEHAADSIEWDAAVHFAIIDNQLFVKRFHHAWQTRAMATLLQIYRAIITSPEPLPDVE